jgi:CRP/FNR family nitrogen fixation transcriptional regulator
MVSQTVIRRNRSRPPAAYVARSAPTNSHSIRASNNLMGAKMSFARNAEIYSENEPIEYLYRVISGAVRAYKVLNDGRRQIGAFYLPGDIFALEVGDEHLFSAEAIVDSEVLVVKRSVLVALAARDIKVAGHLCMLTAEELQRAHDHLLLLIKAAQERVASFLLEMAARSASANELHLPMTRQDVADYLGLTIETVSRTLTQLQKSGTIKIPTSRHIILRSRATLSRLSA